MIRRCVGNLTGHTMDPRHEKGELFPQKEELSEQERVWTRTDQGMRRWAEEWKAKYGTPVMVKGEPDHVSQKEAI